MMIESRSTDKGENSTEKDLYCHRVIVQQNNLLSHNKGVSQGKSLGYTLFLDQILPFYDETDIQYDILFSGEMSTFSVQNVNYFSTTIPVLILECASSKIAKIL